MSEPPQQPPHGPQYPQQPGEQPPWQQQQWGQQQYGAQQGQPWEQQQGGYPQDPNQQQHPYAQQGPYGTPAPAAQGLRLDFGGRLQQRPEPRFGISLAAAGIGIAVIGVLIWSFGYLIQGIHFDSERGGVTGDDRRFLGFGLSLLLVAAGYALTILRKRGPLATAGALGAAIGVPVALAFVTLDFTGGGSDGFPFNTDLVYLISVIVWLASYLFVPGMRGRAFLLAIAALTFAGYLEFKTVSDSVGRATASIFGSTSLDVGDVSTGGGAAVGLIFGLGYYAIAAFLDRKQMHGASVALAAAGAYTTISGVAYGILTFKQIGTGVELIILGAGLSWYGAWSGRRFTTWFWMAGFVVGFGLVVQKALPDSPAGSGITLIVIGLAVVALSQLVTSLLREPPDLDNGSHGATPAVPAGRRH